MIYKKRAWVGNIEFVLLKKDVDVENVVLTKPTTDLTLLYIDDKISAVNENIDAQSIEITTLADKINSLPIVEQSTQSVEQVQIDFSSELINAVSNSPGIGNILSYDDDGLVWKQSPYERLADLENSTSNYNSIFTTEYLETGKINLPFAVTWGTYNWGGPGNAGIFFHDPGTQPIDSYSIKMGSDNDSLSESGYTFGTVTGLAMRFANGYGTNRGFVWTRYEENNIYPHMALDVNPDGGTLTVRKDIVLNVGVFTSNADQPTQGGYLNVPSYSPSSITNSLISCTGVGSTYEDYVLMYEDRSGDGHITLKKLPISTETKCVEILSPAVGNYRTMFYTTKELEVQQITTIISGAGFCGLGWELYYGSDRSAAGTEIITATTISKTTGDILTSFTTSTIPSNTWVWIEVSLLSPTVYEFNLTMEYIEA